MLKGKLGWKGERGYSAYEIAVQHGYEGSEQDWLATLGTSSHFEQDIEVYTTTTIGETIFALPTSYTSSSFVEVYVNGMKLTTEEYTLDAANERIILNEGLEVVGTQVEVVLITMSTNNLPITSTITSESTNDTASGTKSVYDALQTKVNVSDFAIITGSYEYEAGVTGKQIHLDYPTGFTKDNCIVESVMLRNSSQNYWGTGTVMTLNASVSGQVLNSVTLATESITLYVRNLYARAYTSETTPQVSEIELPSLDYKVVLRKIS